MSDPGFLASKTGEPSTRRPSDSFMFKFSSNINSVDVPRSIYNASCVV